MSIDPVVASEFPELRLWTVVVDDLPPMGRRSPAVVRERLRALSDGFRGSQAVMMRSQPIPQAYRVFMRQLGVDPDQDRPPIEAIAVERLKHGGFRSHGLLFDALTIAMMETSVPLWAVDGVVSDLVVRPGGDGRLVVADSDGPLGTLLAPLDRREATRSSTSVTLFSVQVAGVPSIHVEEALWIVQDMLSAQEES